MEPHLPQVGQPSRLWRPVQQQHYDYQEHSDEEFDQDDYEEEEYDNEEYEQDRTVNVNAEE